MAKSSLILAASAALCITSALAAGSPQLETDTMVVDFNGNSGSFKLYFQGNTTGKFWNINYQELQEVDQNGNAVNGRSMGLNSGATVTTGSVTDENGAFYYYVNSVNTGGSNIGNPSTQIQTRLYVNDSEATIPGTNVTVPVTRNTLKISMLVNGWTFANPNNDLQLSVKINSAGRGNSQNPTTATAGNTRKMRMSGDGTYSGEMEFESYCYINGSSTSSEVTQGGNGNIYTFTFPQGNTISWDPTLYTVMNGAGGMMLSMGALLALAVAVVSVL